MKPTLIGLAVAFATFAIWACRVEAQLAAHPKQIKAVRTDVPPKLDGKLDDPCWKKAARATDFIQTEPEEGQPETNPTVVYVLYDDVNLYVAFNCLSSDPSRIVGRIVERDGYIWNDDLVGMTLDTFHDYQSGFYFFVNAAGSQLDGRSDQDGQRKYNEWDGVWDAESSINDSGWVTEIAIPFRTLRFPESEDQTWGINFTRTYQSPVYGWSAWSFIPQVDGTLSKVSRAGDLVGLRGLRSGLHVQALPYITGRRELLSTGRTWGKDAGLDLKYGIASDITVDITVNPDFAHIEADEYYINLNRYELYLPEKRPFFLEGRALFRTPIELFYTRRIQNPLGGMRMTGSRGDYAFLLLDVVDERTHEPDANVFLLRTIRNVRGRSTLGLLAATRDWKGGYGRSLGADGSFFFGHEFHLTTQIARTIASGIRGEDWAGDVTLGYRRGRLDLQFGWRQYGAEFDPNQTGFFGRDAHVGNRRGYTRSRYRWPINSHGISEIDISGRFQSDKDTDESTWEREGSGELSVRFSKGGTLNFYFSDWRILHEHKAYRGNSYSLNVKAVHGKYLIGWLSAGMGDQYDWKDDYFGRIRKASLSFLINPREEITLSVSANSVWEYYPSGRFDEWKRTGSLHLSWFATRDLFWRAFYQINPRTYEYILNMLFSYTTRPFSKFYIAYNETRGPRAADGSRHLDRIFFTKLAYLFEL